MRDNDLFTRREAELVLLEKGQCSKRYKVGDIWEVNFDEIREAFEDFQPTTKIVRCRDCKHRGNSEKCVLSAIAEEKGFPLFMLDNSGNWFCADGERNGEIKVERKETEESHGGRRI